MDPKALFSVSYGMYVITAKKGGRMNGQTANTLFQISSSPLAVAVGINKQNLTHEYIKAGGLFAASVLSETVPLSVIGNFGFQSGRDVDKFAAVDYRKTANGLPYLCEHTLAFLEAKVIGEFDAGTHTIFIGELSDAGVLSPGKPMTYAYYHQVKGGSTPPSAPTFVAKQAEAASETISKEDDQMEKYECGVCGYLYDPAKGDPDHGVAPGTAFADLPDDWTCPVCGAGKEEFSKAD